MFSLDKALYKSVITLHCITELADILAPAVYQCTPAATVGLSCSSLPVRSRLVM